ncbi:MAG: succinate dehydrogenase cytochrome b subunit [Verrucomicrobiales bacterium]
MMKSFRQALCRFYSSSIGKKILVALTGLVLVGFLIGHLAANLLIFLGADALNDYAHKLRSMGPLLWAARLGLLAAVVLHIVATIHLTVQNRLARPDAYIVESTLRASFSSRVMMWSGVTIAVFVVYHLMHYTWGTFNRYRDPEGPYFLANGEHNVYKMMVDGFREPANSLFYTFAILLLCSHLRHGVPSLFQTLGLTTARSRGLIRIAGWTFAIIIFLGYFSIPLSIMAGWVR